MNNNNSTLLSDIRTNYHRLSPAQKGIADYVLANTKEVVYLTITDLAEKCSVSETTILRFLNKINLTSYQVFRVGIAQHEANGAKDFTASEISQEDNADEIIKKIISSTTTAVNDISNILSSKTVDKCTSMILNAERVYIYGNGSSAYIAGDFHHKLLRMGISSSTDDNDHMISISSNHAKKNDLFILVSHSGETKTILSCAKQAKTNGAKTISLTSYANSSLSQVSNETLLSSSSETKFRPDAMLSRIIQLVIIDIISVCCFIKMGNKSIAAVKKSQKAVAQHKR